MTAVGTADWLFYGKTDGGRGVRKESGGKQISVDSAAGQKLVAYATGVYTWSIPKSSTGSRR